MVYVTAVLAMGCDEVYPLSLSISKGGKRDEIQGTTPGLFGGTQGLFFQTYFWFLHRASIFQDRYCGPPRHHQAAGRHNQATSASLNIREPAHSRTHSRTHFKRVRRLLILLLVVTTTPTGSRLPLALDATRAAAAEGRVERKVNVLLAIGAHEEGGHVHDLLSDADVALADEHAGVVHRLGEAELEHEGLEAALEERLSVEREDVIELVLGLVLRRERGERRGFDDVSRLDASFPVVIGACACVPPYTD